MLSGLRMQGFFNEVALDLVKKDGDPLPVLVNAAERKNAEGKPLFIRLTRGQTINVKVENYIEAAEAIGNSSLRISQFPAARAKNNE